MPARSAATGGCGSSSGKTGRGLRDSTRRRETIASTSVDRRAVVELLARLDDTGQQNLWPIAVVAESPDDRSVMFRTYCSQMPVDGRHHVRPPIIEPGDEPPEGVVSRHFAALVAGDVEAAVKTFTADGYLREAIGPNALHRGTEALRSYYSKCFSAGGGIELECCRVTDDDAPLCRRVQPRPVGSPRFASASRPCGVRKRLGRTPLCGSDLRRCRSS